MWAILLALVIIFLIYYMYKPKEKFNSNYYESSTAKDMDYLKDGKGRTLNDYVLEKSFLSGSNIVPPV